MEGYTKLIYNFDKFLENLNSFIKENNYTRLDSANKLGVSRSIFRFWFNGGTISVNTYNRIKYNLQKYNLL